MSALTALQLTPLRLPDCTATVTSYFLCCFAIGTKDEVVRMLDLSIDSMDTAVAAVVAFFIL